MDPNRISSSAYIGDVIDHDATANLAAVFESFELSARANEIRQRRIPAPQYPALAYLGLMMMGPFAILSPAVMNPTINRLYDLRANHLERRASRAMPPYNPIS